VRGHRHVSGVNESMLWTGEGGAVEAISHAVRVCRVTDSGGTPPCEILAP